MIKRVFFFIFCIFLFCLPSLAVPDIYSIYDDTSWADVPASEPLSESISDYSEYYISGYDIVPLYSLDNGTTPINSGLRSLMRSIIGNYSPVVVQYQYTNGSNTAYLREILPDYEWMFNFGLFSLVLFCVFRMGGGILRTL